MLLLICVFLCVLLPLAQCTINIDDYFNVQQGGEDVGGCDEIYPAGGTRTGKQWLQTWFEEAQTLSNTGYDATNSYAKSPVARINLAIFLGIQVDSSDTAPVIQSRLNDVKANFNQMKQYFAGPPAADQKTSIYCSSQWFEEKQPTDPVQYSGSSGSASGSNSGSASNSKSGSGGPKQTIKQVYQDELKSTGVKPYWVPSRQVYLFSTPEYAVDFCADKYNNFGGTQDTFKDANGDPGGPGTITICMSRVFKDPDGGGVETLGAQEPQSGELLTLYVSKGVTLLHEMFHLVLGNQRTPDVVSNLKGVLQKAAVDLRNKNPATASRTAWLPESMATFAEAQYLSTLKTFSIDKSGKYWGWTGTGAAAEMTP